MDIFVTACLGITAVTLIALNYWVAQIASDTRKARKALEEVTRKELQGDSSSMAGSPSWSPADEAA